ncbi:hypothetical protein G5B37_12140 [Rasiella rasia]|uniref:DUF4890 domain-containing protein n=1 Tax=Rasiella rasia TaxID=2744027 RepID=A0A6G6GP77_9FLAO|nr:hypothetical protein [Rasiella rasia]QIE60284.1 hypothetical protein G5B37_12140 [Rasiella rasia]
MKNVLMIALVLFSYTLIAQPGDRRDSEKRKEKMEKMKDWTPEEIADIKTKKLALHLDLTDAQQKKVYPIELQIAKKRQEMRLEKEKKTEKTSKEAYERQKNLLDEKLSVKQQYKSVLTAEQYEKWEKTSKGMKRGKRLKTKHRNR